MITDSENQIRELQDEIKNPKDKIRKAGRRGGTLGLSTKLL